jgi:hypothetical protein
VVTSLRSGRSWVIVVLVGLGVLTLALLFAADYVEDVFGTPLASPRALDAVIPVFMVAIWNAIPAALAVVAYHQRVVGAVVAFAFALVSPACVLYAANEVAQDPDGSFIRLAYVFVPLGPIVVCAGVVCAVATVRALRVRPRNSGPRCPQTPRDMRGFRKGRAGTTMTPMCGLPVRAHSPPGAPSASTAGEPLVNGAKLCNARTELVRCWGDAPSPTGEV